MALRTTLNQLLSISGTTWLQEIIYLIQTKGDIVAARSKPCYIRCPLLEDARAQKKIIPQMPLPRLMKTHISFHLMPPGIHSHNIKMVYILRNPKDVAVSYFHFYQSLTELGSFAQPWEEFLAMFLEGYILYQDWLTNVQSWWTQRHNPNILIVSYEDMKINIAGVIRKIAEFCGIELDEGTVKIIEENTTFSVMKDNPSTNFAALKDIFKLPFMRKGEVGDWKNYFSVAQNEKFDRLLAEKVCDQEFLNALIFNID